MSVIDNTNFLSVSNINLSIARLPEMTFFVQKITLPGVGSTPTLQKNPFSDIKLAGDKGDFDELNVKFILDAEMASYVELWKWWKGLVSPVNFNDYATLQTQAKAFSKEGLYSDLTVSILNNNGKAIRSIVYTNAFPIKISSVEMAYDLQEVQYPVVSVDFAYTSFDFS